MRGNNDRHMSATTVIRNASWAVTWSETTGHRYMNGVDIAFDHAQILHVGGHFNGPVNEEVDGSGLMVMPGLVNAHSHPGTEPLRKGITDEVRSPNFYHSSLYEFLTVFDNDPAGKIASTRVAMAELLQSGCTSVVDFSVPHDNWLDVLAQTGIRAWIAPLFRDASWRTTDGHSISYDWSNPSAGPDGLRLAKQLIESARKQPGDRLSGIVAPAQIDTVSEALLRDAYRVATELDVPLQTHAAQSVNEFHEMIRRHGRTPIRWMADLGVLSDRTLIAHGIFLDHHPWLHWSDQQDLDLLAESGACVVHCPTVFMRRGIALHTFGRYLRAGVRMAIGTDTYPMDMINEMRNTITAARLVGGTVDDLQTSDVFNAATIGGADALRRPDLGRLTPGARADLVLVDLACAGMRPLREPVRSLVFVAGPSAVRDVYVDGQIVVRNGRCLTVDLPAELDALEAAQQRSINRAPGLDYRRRNVDEMAPMVFSRSQ